MVLCACMLWLFCRWVSSKDIDPLMIEPMTVLAAEVVNKLQMGFPPSFFDNQVHLLVHLPREVQLCGPVHSRWMYFLERYMGHLKKFGRNRSKIEGSICEGHVQAEAMFLCRNIVRQLGASCTKLWIEEEREEERKQSEVLIGGRTPKTLNPTEFSQVMNFILHNHSDMEEWASAYVREKSSTPPRLRRTFPRIRQFMVKKIMAHDENPSLVSAEDPPITPRIRDLVDGPKLQAWSRSAMWAQGRHFRVYELDAKKKRTQDSGTLDLNLIEL